MRFFKHLFDKRQARKAIQEVSTELETKPAEDFFHHVSPPMAGTASTEEDVSVTAQYSIVVKKMRHAVEENKDARRAARRLMDAIGVGPEPKKSSSQNT